MADTGNRHPISRRHISKACMPCRESKIKCDGERPICGICSTKRRQCNYDINIDKRKISLRKAVEIYSRRVNQLESCLRRVGVDVPDPAPDDCRLLRDLTDSYGTHVNVDSEATGQHAIEQGHVQVPLGCSIPTISETGLISDNQMMSSGIEPDRPPLILTSIDSDIPPGDYIPTPSHHYSCHNWDLDADLVWYMSTLPSLSMDIDDALVPGSLPTLLADESPAEGLTHSTSDPSAPATLNEDEEGDTDEEDTAEVTNQFCDRLGTLLPAFNGEWRFYGATSNLHLVHSSSKHNLPCGSRNRSNPQAKFDYAGISQVVDDELISHLINLYFTWQNPSLHVVDRAAFEAAREKYLQTQVETGLHSEFLMNSMCAVGAAFERVKHPGLPAPLTEFFATRAKSLLDMELDHPRLSTVQGLAILSIHEGAATRDTRGWLYSGMAIRLAFDLGLHVDPTPYVASGKMTTQEARVRNVTFWGTFATDRMWGFYLGRPFHNTLENVTVRRPAEDSFRETGALEALWTPYGTPSKEQETWPNAQELISGRWVALYEIMSELGHKMYCKTNVSNMELQALAEKTFNELVVWKSRLPAELAIDMNNLASGLYLPHTLILHMQFAFCMMILHRPFVAKRYIQPFPRVGKGPEHARRMCVQSATDIAKLIGEYERRYSLRRANVLLVHMAFTAALILVYATVSEINRNIHTELSSHLDVCCHALSEFGVFYESASRSLDILLSIKRMWQARLVVGSVRQKRPWEITGGNGTAAKKQCMATN